MVNRLDYTDANIEWADAVVTTGGDGTYLLAASRIQDCKKPVIGFNSDPSRSKGQLCLPKKYSFDTNEAVHKLLKVSSVHSSEIGLIRAQHVNLTISTLFYFVASIFRGIIILC